MKNYIAALVVLTTVALTSSSFAAEPAPAKERKTIQQNLLAKYDANKNGVLDAEEKETIKKARETSRQESLQQFDKNQDGKLDKAERAAARSAKRKVSKKQV